MNSDHFSKQTWTTIEFASELIQKSGNAVILTGAGISTPSGIPDFRSEGTGLWSVDEPLEVASLSTFRYNPERFFEWIQPLVKCIINAHPNPAHKAIEKLEKCGHIKTIITQNIDNLHQKAGSKNVIETHGSLESMTCTECFFKVSSEPYINPFVEFGKIPYCPDCNGVLKPDVILFGEQMPYKAWGKALSATHSCDLMIVAGSSLEVMPVAGLPMQALDKCAHLIIINQTPTYLGVRADALIMDDVAKVIPEISKLVLGP